MENWKNERVVPSPYESWPGTITVPLELDAEQFVQWWQKTQAQDLATDDQRPDEFKSFEARHHLVLACDLKRPDGRPLDWSAIKPDGSNLPSMKIALLVIRATQQILIEARVLPKLAGPSSNGTKETEAAPSKAGRAPGP